MRRPWYPTVKFDAALKAKGHTSSLGPGHTATRILFTQISISAFGLSTMSWTTSYMYQVSINISLRGARINSLKYRDRISPTARVHAHGNDPSKANNGRYELPAIALQAVVIHYAPKLAGAVAASERSSTSTPRRPHFSDPSVPRLHPRNNRMDR